MKYVLLAILTTTILMSYTLSSAEIVPIWHTESGAGEIHDIEFLRGEDSFILIAGIGENGVIEIRQTKTGDLIRSFPVPYLSYNNQIEVTPDSSKILITTGGDKEFKPTIELRNIEDFSVINSFKLEMDIDSLDEKGGKLYYKFRQAMVDPIRPLVYIIVEKTNYISNYTPEKYWLRVYNYKTMKEVTDLTPIGFENEKLKCFDISDDSKYLAALNDGRTYLKVWDLEKLELAQDIQLYDKDYNLDPNYFRCVTDDIEFSSNNNNLLYLSGKFPDNSVEYSSYGFYKFLIAEKQKIKEMQEENKVGGNLILLNKDNYLFLSSGGDDKIFNVMEKKLEVRLSDVGIELPSSVDVIFSHKYQIFIGCSKFKVGAIVFDNKSNIKIEETGNTSISPNPTNSFVNIIFDCTEPIINYQINNLEGLLISQSSMHNQNNPLQIDFSGYTPGVYFLMIRCGNESKSYKVVRE